MYVSKEKIEEAIRIFKEHNGIMRTSEALDAGIYQRTLYFMRDEEYLTQLQRGVYQLNEREPLGYPDLVIVAQKIPAAVICLISALDLHELTDQIPHQVHIALPRTSRDPVMDYPPIKVYRFSKETLNAGVDIQKIDGVDINVFNPAKTIADCFKFRNQIGKEVAIEALKEGIRMKKATYQDIVKYAELCRVKNVIKPYMEAL
jgi:predicted transcriptional regulator of viral defense system